MLNLFLDRGKVREVGWNFFQSLKMFLSFNYFKGWESSGGSGEKKAKDKR